MKAARGLHARLLHPDVLQSEKSLLAREIAGMLFSAEANSMLCNRARILFLRVKSHAHACTQPGAPQRIEGFSIGTDYDELESLMSAFRING